MSIKESHLESPLGTAISYIGVLLTIILSSSLVIFMLWKRSEKISSVLISDEQKPASQVTDQTSHHAALKQYHEQYKKLGHPTHKIRHHLINSGWPKHIVDEHIPHEEPEVKKAETTVEIKQHENYQKYQTLVNYVNQAYKFGLTRDQIKGKLLVAGWKEGVIDAVVDYFDRKK